MLNGRAVLFPSGTFNYVLPDVVYLGYAVDMNDVLHFRCVGVLEEALEAVRASNILRNESGPLLDMRLVVYDSQGGNSTVLAGIISTFAALPHSLGIIGGLLSGERAQAHQSMVVRESQQWHAMPQMRPPTCFRRRPPCLLACSARRRPRRRFASHRCLRHSSSASCVQTPCRVCTWQT